MDINLADPLTNPIIILFSALLPLGISFVKQAGWTSSVNSLIALLCYIVVGIVAAIVSGEELSLENALAFITAVTVYGTVAYNLFWANFGPNGESFEGRLEEVTSFVK